MCLVCLGVAVGSVTGVFSEGEVVQETQLPQQPVVSQVAPWQTFRQGDVVLDGRCTKLGKSKVFEGVTYVCKEEGKKLKWVKQKP